MTLTKELAIKLHRKLWRWIADETERRKEVVEKYDYPLFKRKKYITAAGVVNTPKEIV